LGCPRLTLETLENHLVSQRAGLNEYYTPGSSDYFKKFKEFFILLAWIGEERVGGKVIS
jgi:hypothetical protein